MKLLKKFFAGTTLAVAMASGHAALIAPNTGDGELLAVFFTVGNNNSFTIDLGVTISSFNTALNQSFSLSASPLWNTFLTNNVLNSPITFSVIGADSTGGSLNAGDKNLFVTIPGNSVAPTLTNSQLTTRAGNVNTYQIALNSTPNGGTFNGTHSTATDGFSLDTSGTGPTTSFTTLSGGVLAGFPLVAAGGFAELIKLSTTQGSSSTPSTVTDFYSGSETPTNLGAYFTLDTGTGTLSYFGEPTVVNPVPEASEWAMMLSGLGMLGLMVRRRRNNI
jgi:hypothetical protein